MSGPLYWIWGAGPKSAEAKREAERVTQSRPGWLDQAWKDYHLGNVAEPPISDLGAGAVDRLRARVRQAPQESLFFGAPSLKAMSGGLVTRARERGHHVNKLIFEDHGLKGGRPAEVMLFFGSDAVSLRTLPDYRHWFEQMRQVLAPNAEVFLVHCWAAADRCQLTGELSRLFDRPVYAADFEQRVGNQAIEGKAYRVHGNDVRRVSTFTQAVLHFD